MPPFMSPYTPDMSAFGPLYQTPYMPQQQQDPFAMLMQPGYYNALAQLQAGQIPQYTGPYTSLESVGYPAAGSSQYTDIDPFARGGILDLPIGGITQDLARGPYEYAPTEAEQLRRRRGPAPSGKIEGGGF